MLNLIKQKSKFLFTIRKVNTGYHIPILAAFSMGIPLFLVLFLNNIKIGLTMSLSALIVVYLPIFGTLSERILTILACSFGFILSYFLGLVFSFNHFISALVFGIFSMTVNWITSYLKVKPPKAFFFIMLAASGSCIPYNLNAIPKNIGLVSIGAIMTSFIAIFYSIFFIKNKNNKINNLQIVLKKNKYTDIIESIILGFFMFISLWSGFLLDIKNPYWIPVSCAAVMQGATKYHIWERVIQRILGTFLGLGLCWIVLSINKSNFSICVSIIVLQFLLETLVPRNYGLAVIFITPLTILLTEFSSPIIKDTNYFIYLRLMNTVLGSFIGAIGGWAIYHEKIHYAAIKKIRSIKYK